MKNKIIIGIIYILGITLSGVLYYNVPALAAVSGETLISVQDPTATGSLIRARRVKDAGNISDDQTTGILACGLMGHDGSAWDKLGITSGSLDVNVTATVAGGGDVTPADAYVNPTDATDSHSLNSIYNGTTWDRVRGDIANGVDVDITRGAVQTPTNTLEIPDAANLSAVSTVQNSADITCGTSDSKVVVKITYSAADVTAPFRIYLEDDDDDATYSAQITPANASFSDGSRFFADTIVVDSLGATNFQIRLDGVPTNSGNITAYGDCI